MRHLFCGTMPEDIVSTHIERLPHSVPPATVYFAFSGYGVHSATADAAVEALRERLQDVLPGCGLTLSCVSDGFVVAGKGLVDECYLLEAGRLAGEIYHVRASTPFVAEHCFGSVGPAVYGDCSARPTTPPLAP
jgi:hypothetical protein